MKAFLLSAGLGTRLRPLTDKMPKCLLPINGKPLLRIWLELLSRYGVDQVLINTHWHHEKVVNFLEGEKVRREEGGKVGRKDRDQMSEVRRQRSGKDRRENGGKDKRKDEHRTSNVQHRPSEIEKKFHGVKMMNERQETDFNRQSSIINRQSSIQKVEPGRGSRITNQQITNNSLTVRLFYEPELLGSAGTLLANRDWVDDGEPFFILYGDNLTEVNLLKMYAFHKDHEWPFTLGVFKADEPERCGIADIDESGKVVDFVEKPENPKSNLAHAGISIADKRIFDFYPPNAKAIRPLDLGFHVIPNLVGEMKAYFIEEFLMDIGTPDSYENAQKIYPQITQTCPPLEDWRRLNR